MSVMTERVGWRREAKEDSRGRGHVTHLHFWYSRNKSHIVLHIKKNNRAGKTARWMVKGEGGRVVGGRCDCGILEIPALVIWGFEVPLSMGGHCEGGVPELDR